MGLFNRRKLSRLETIGGLPDPGLDAILEKRRRLAASALDATRTAKRKPGKRVRHVHVPLAPSRWRELRAADRELEDSLAVGTTHPLAAPLSKRQCKLAAYPARRGEGRRRMAHGVPRGRGLVL